MQDNRVKDKKYTAPLPYSWDVGCQKDILRWPSQQKTNFTLNGPKMQVQSYEASHKIMHLNPTIIGKKRL